MGRSIVSAMLGLFLRVGGGGNGGSAGRLVSGAWREIEVHCSGEGCLQRDRRENRRQWCGCEDRIGKG